MYGSESEIAHFSNGDRSMYMGWQKNKTNDPYRNTKKVDTKITSDFIVGGFAVKRIGVMDSELRRSGECAGHQNSNTQRSMGGR